MKLSPLMRNVHRFALGFQLAGLAIFLLVFTVMGSPGWLVLAGWCLFYGALSTTALVQDHKARKAPGIEA